MANCSNCGAPLPLHTSVCGYCHTRNEIDLKGIHFHTDHPPQKPRICPRCRVNLETVNLSSGKSFLIEHCQKCLGLFLDPGELEALLAQETAHIYDIDFRQLDSLLTEHHTASFPVAYLKCPICATPMHRVHFGSRSGVIVDKCKYHGIWMDNGEFRQLLEWVKSGGNLLQQKREQEKREEEEKRRKEEARDLARFNARFPESSSESWHSRHEDQDLLDLLVGWVRKMFTMK